jgi:hypothetical protein
MHDPSGPLSITGRILPALIAVLLLTGILFLFRNPSATMTDIGEIAIHASALSMSDSAWYGTCWLPDWIEPPIPGEIAFGLHDVFPYKLFTIRDVRTGDILVDIRSSIAVSLDENTPENHQITAILKDTGAMVLICDRNSESWPVYLFSIITDG